MSTPTLVRLAELACAVRFDALPAAVVARAKSLILDTLACAYGGFASDASVAVRAAIADAGGHPQSTMIGSGTRHSMAQATLANGTMLRYQDSNDYVFARDPAHPSGNLAAVLAVAERVGASGPAMIAALVAAYEIHLRFAEHAGDPTIWGRGWHHGTNAQFAAAAAAARLLGGDTVDPLRVAHAMAIAGSHHNTLAQLQSGSISMIKATAEAWVAKGAVEAAVLAQHGVTGPLSLIEGRHGWADSVAGRVDLDALTAPLGSDWRLSRVCIKPYPAVASAIAAAAAAIDLHAEVAPRLGDIERLTVHLPAYALGTPSGNPDRRHPANKESADHSFYYCAAVALADGACGEAQFSPERIADPALAALLARTELVADEAFAAAWPGRAGGAITVRFADGTVRTRRCDAPPGHPDNPLSPPALMHKFHESADPVLGVRRAAALAARVATLEDCPDVRDFTPALGPAG
ncbi:MAG: MmgE/PrpD family protein [Lautropia sp.]